MMSWRGPYTDEWMADFIEDWRLEHEAPEEFWSLMTQLTPLELRLVRDVMALAAKRAFEAGSGFPDSRTWPRGRKPPQNHDER
jgi:hypothetical protein